MSYSYSTLATILLTVDRYVTIAYITRYNHIMTKKVVVILIASSLIVPIIMCAVAYFLTGPHTTIFSCSPSHLRSKFSSAAITAMVLVTLAILYILYSRILFSFWKLKRKRSRILRKNKNLVEDFL